MLGILRYKRAISLLSLAVVLVIGIVVKIYRIGGSGTHVGGGGGGSVVDGERRAGSGSLSPRSQRLRSRRGRSREKKSVYGTESPSLGNSSSALPPFFSSSSSNNNSNNKGVGEKRSAKQSISIQKSSTSVSLASHPPEDPNAAPLSNKKRKKQILKEKKQRKKEEAETESGKLRQLVLAPEEEEAMRQRELHHPSTKKAMKVLRSGGPAPRKVDVFVNAVRKALPGLEAELAAAAAASSSEMTTGRTAKEGDHAAISEGAAAAVTAVGGSAGDPVVSRTSPPSSPPTATAATTVSSVTNSSHSAPGAPRRGSRSSTTVVVVDPADAPDAGRGTLRSNSPPRTEVPPSESHDNENNAAAGAAGQAPPPRSSSSLLVVSSSSSSAAAAAAGPAAGLAWSSFMTNGSTPVVAKLEDLYPKKFEVHGHVVVMRLNPGVSRERFTTPPLPQLFAESFLPIVVDVVLLDDTGISGELRRPTLEVLHQADDILYPAITAPRLLRKRWAVADAALKECAAREEQRQRQRQRSASRLLMGLPPASFSVLSSRAARRLRRAFSREPVSEGDENEGKEAEGSHARTDDDDDDDDDVDDDGDLSPLQAPGVVVECVRSATTASEPRSVGADSLGEDAAMLSQHANSSSVLLREHDDFVAFENENDSVLTADDEFHQRRNSSSALGDAPMPLMIPSMANTNTCVPSLDVLESLLSEYVTPCITFTTHIENGIFYGLDVRKVMFSSGNTTERMHFATVDATDEVVVDMFCGIGYFTLPLAVHGRPRVIHALDKNEDSIAFLRLNAVLNRVGHRIRPQCGDNREVGDELIGACDRVLMGYLPSCKVHLSRAVMFLKHHPQEERPLGVIHYHYLAEPLHAKETLWRDLREELGENVVVEGERVLLQALRRVKSYAPKLYHYVADVKFI